MSRKSIVLLAGSAWALLGLGLGLLEWGQRNAASAMGLASAGPVLGLSLACGLTAVCLAWARVLRHPQARPIEIRVRR